MENLLPILYWIGAPAAFLLLCYINHKIDCKYSITKRKESAVVTVIVLFFFELLGVAGWAGVIALIINFPMLLGTIGVLGVGGSIWKFGPRFMPTMKSLWIANKRSCAYCGQHLLEARTEDVSDYPERKAVSLFDYADE